MMILLKDFQRELLKLPVKSKGIADIVGICLVIAGLLLGYWVIAVVGLIALHLSQSAFVGCRILEIEEFLEQKFGKFPGDD